MRSQPAAGEPGPWRRLVADPRHGSLPALLLVLTFVTGLVDAVSILSLGRVFVANMTGNVVFVGFALAGAPGFSLDASLFALGGFLVGAAGGGALVRRFGSDRVILLRNGAVAEGLLLAAAWIAAAGVALPYDSVARDALAALSAMALGVQNAVVRKLAIPDLTTTVLTMTLTGVAADRVSANWATVVRRLMAVATLLAGAVVGALLVRDVSVPYALGLACLLVTAVCTAGARTPPEAPARRP